ncbi:DUF4293 domain-containing protein [Roseivirga misakiensis]|uniref:DUF4293 domain-containing protein n=1 Tax=Roseivirga misakiensis TaxID=1563681 RepID=A0A1E5T4M6_9BACT|nr:DUF4293 domain-containing protein [Roseivirga misakiensis]OEK06332.1 hypothetical protein BFP71_01255 [Roseivirga misakiensis]
MIQRIQTVLLLCVAVCMGMVLAYFIWAEVNESNNTVSVMTAFKMEVIDTAGTLSDKSDDTVVSTTSTWYIGVLAIAASLVAIFSVFQFKNRLNQMKLGALNALLMAATLGLSFYNISEFEKISPEIQGSIQAGFFFPAAAMILNILANRFIRKDEKLVKSVDRIR